MPYLHSAGWLTEPTEADVEFLRLIVPPVAATVDRLDQIAARLSFVFGYSAAQALEQETVRQEALASRDVVVALAEELSTAPPVYDKDTFRALAGRVRDRTGQKGKALFHPIRLVMTGEQEGLELDLAVPAIERGAALAEGPSGFVRIAGARERAAAFAAGLAAL